MGKARIFVIHGLKLLPYVAAVLVSFWGSIQLMFMEEPLRSDQNFLEVILWVLGFLSITVLVDRIDSFQQILNEIKLSKEHLEIKIDEGVTSTRIGLDDTQRRLGEIIHITHDTYLNAIMHVYDDKWTKWMHELTRDSRDWEGILSYAWKELMESYLKEETDWVDKNVVKTTSDTFTQLVSSISKFLYEKLISKSEGSYLYRYHITGMLPEEFFNGPQIEYTTVDYTPVIFCHRFEDEKYISSHYKIIEDKKELVRMDVKRCIIVRDASMVDEKYSALSTFQALFGQTKLSIHKGGPKPIPLLTKNDYYGAVDRLFVHCEHKVKGYVDERKKNKEHFIHEIIDSNRYSFYPITETSKVEQNDEHQNFEDLINYFSRYFNHGTGDVFYYCVRDNDESRVKLQKHFRKGGWPEITLFGVRHENESKPKSWILGIKGHYTPFTREIEISLLKSTEVNQMVADLQPIIDSKTLRELKL